MDTKQIISAIIDCGLDRKEYGTGSSRDWTAKCTILLGVEAKKADGTVVKFDTVCRIDTPVEIDYFRNGGILHKVLRDYVEEDKKG